MTATFADLLLVGGLVLESAGAGPARPSQVAVRGGAILAVAQSLSELRGPATTIVDVRGGTICPGLVDGHSHPVMGLDLADSADLAGCRTMADVLAILRAHVRGQVDEAFITAAGLDPNVFGDHPPDNARITEAVGGRPALVHLFDGHAAIATPSALTAAGVTGALSLPAGATVEVDGDGRPTGLLLEEAAVDLVSRLVPVAPFAVRREQLRLLLQDMASVGLTGAHVMDAKGDAAALFAALDDEEELPLRLRIAPWCRPDDDPQAILAMQGAGGRMWRVDGVKMFLDGTIDGGTAWLSEPDCLGASTTPGWDPTQFTARVAAFDRAAVPVAVHAIGDAAVAHVLDSMSSLSRRVDVTRHRIEHLESVPDEVIPRFAELGVAASMQPRHATDYTRADGTDNWSRRLGPERAAQGWRCADIVRTGGVVILGSDWPVAPFDPRLTLVAATLRRSPVDLEAPAVQPLQAMTVVEALAACTIAPAWVAKSSGGQVRPGADADFTVFQADPLTVALADLGSLPVTHTISGGRVTFAAS